MDVTPPGDPRRAVAGAVESLVARRLGRLFVPLGLLVAFGTAWALLGAPADRTAAVAVAGAAPLAALSALAEGLRTVRRVLAREGRSWTGPVAAGGVPVWIYGLGVLAVGLRGLAALAGPEPWARGLPAVALVALGALVLRGWWRMGEVRKMAALLDDLDGVPGGGA